MRTLYKFTVYFLAVILMASATTPTFTFAQTATSLIPKVNSLETLGKKFLQHYKEVHDALYAFKGTDIWNMSQNSRDVEYVHKFRQQLASLNPSDPADLELVNPLWDRVKTQFKPSQQELVRKEIFILLRSLAIIYYGDAREILKLYQDGQKYRSALALLAAKAGIKGGISGEDIAEFILGSSTFVGFTHNMKKVSVTSLDDAVFDIPLIKVLHDTITQPNAQENQVARVLRYYHLDSLETDNPTLKTTIRNFERRMPDLNNASEALIMAYIRTTKPQIYVKLLNDSGTLGYGAFKIWGKEYYYGVVKPKPGQQSDLNIDRDGLISLPPGKAAGTMTLWAYVDERVIAEQTVTMKRTITANYYKPMNVNITYYSRFSSTIYWEPGPAGVPDKYIIHISGGQPEDVDGEYPGWSIPNVHYKQTITIHAVYGDLISEPYVMVW
ncbi:hypothetical protein SY83_04660 [Paenibacillus swuensis]|uniref:SbsC C-terminal domain-containing protein n=1 Tax=Paenibacillus swuensis TaxID=1178515 RepID=A0A172TF85_9BACL|nr:hypothetical protein [Paenibacillus swuensis]ANE45708.1 hypothetical protein SY83_04660 [Paenibacillus swuensis]